MRRVLALAARERRAVLAELAGIRGLMPLLMKRRNRSDWSPGELGELRSQFRRLRSLSPYLAVLVLPGGFALLPLLAWWLDRRRAQREPPRTPGPQIGIDQAAGKADAPP